MHEPAGSVPAVDDEFKDEKMAKIATKGVDTEITAECGGEIPL